ncbi:cysteine protease [Brevundimonas sp.]|uniref:cysteine protease n=1 Tax=Brevundimonas sp. TaxID=1871086 RepID=UPI0028B0959E|nr:cysteine protease [Brevundimonas sp.]
MRLPRLATLLGGLLLSRRGRGFAGRHAGKLALATLAFELWQKHQASRPGATPHSRARAKSGPGRRWSGRSRR